MTDLAFYDRISEQPLRLIPEYAGRYVLGTVDDIREANRHYWQRRHRDATRQGVRLDGGDQSPLVRAGARPFTKENA